MDSCSYDAIDEHIYSSEITQLHLLLLYSCHSMELTLMDQLYSPLVLIDGLWLDAHRHFSVSNPATEEQIATLPHCNAELIQKALQAAAQSFKSWRQVEQAQLNATC